MYHDGEEWMWKETSIHMYILTLGISNEW
jgi:hypothetical protein